MTAGTYKFILGHLSQENNTPLQAENSAVGALGDYERNSDYILHIAKPEGQRNGGGILIRIKSYYSWKAERKILA